MDDKDTISMLGSKTFRNALGAFIVSGLTIFTLLTGKTFDVKFIQESTSEIIAIIPHAVAAWFSYRAMIGRMQATKQIGGEYAEKLRARTGNK